MKYRKVMGALLALIMVAMALLHLGHGSFASPTGQSWLPTRLVYYDDGALPNGDWRWEVWQAGATWGEAGSDFSLAQATYYSNNDIRIGAADYPFSVASAHRSPLSGNPLTWCETVFNQNMSFSVGGSPTSYDIQTVALHEFGHWLALGDVYDNSSKVMYYSISYGTVRTTLHQDDINGIIAIYGN
jgi:hypothetical protein